LIGKLLNREKGGGEGSQSQNKVGVKIDQHTPP